MIDLDSKEANPEMKAVASKIKKSTSQLVRFFHCNDEMQLKLQSNSDTRSAELSGFIDAFSQMRDLWWTLLSTPKEEQDSMNKQI